MLFFFFQKEKKSVAIWGKRFDRLNNRLNLSNAKRSEILLIAMKSQSEALPLFLSQKKLQSFSGIAGDRP